MNRIELIITRENNSIVETSYLLGNEANREHLKLSIEQYKTGKATKKELIYNE